MNNPASILVLLFLAITFLQSGYDKLFYWKDNVEWLKGHFEKTFLANFVPIALMKILILELIAGTLALIGIVQLFVNDGKLFGFWACIISCITLIILLFGQRIAKDYDGARTIAIYFIPAVMGVYWLS
jgi:uncharacterized membrane protein YphA (DoxX/SURF4 family)